MPLRDMGCAFFALSCIRKKILDFHKHGVSTGILNSFAKYYVFI